MKPGLKCTLTVDPGVAGVTINVDSTTGFPAQGIISIDAEEVAYVGVTATAFTGCTRAYDNTSASAHNVNSTVFGCIAADHHNALKDAVKALQAKVGINTNGATASTIDAAQLAGSSSASIASLTASSTIIGGTLKGTQLLGKGTSPTAATNVHANVNTVVVAGFDMVHRITFNVVTGTIAAGSKLFTVTLGTAVPNLVAFGIGANITTAAWDANCVQTSTTTYDVYNLVALVVSAGYSFTALAAGW